MKGDEREADGEWGLGTEWVSTLCWIGGAVVGGGELPPLDAVLPLGCSFGRKVWMVFLHGEEGDIELCDGV